MCLTRFPVSALLHVRFGLQKDVHILQSMHAIVLVQVAVLSDAAIICVFREGHVGHLFQKSNAHNSGALNASRVRHETGVKNTHRPRVQDCSPRSLC